MSTVLMAVAKPTSPSTNTRVLGLPCHYLRSQTSTTKMVLPKATTLNPTMMLFGKN